MSYFLHTASPVLALDHDRSNDQGVTPGLEKPSTPYFNPCAFSPFLQRSALYPPPCCAQHHSVLICHSSHQTPSQLAHRNVIHQPCTPASFMVIFVVLDLTCSYMVSDSEEACHRRRRSVVRNRSVTLLLTSSVGACGKTSLLCSFALGEFPKEYVSLHAPLHSLSLTASEATQLVPPSLSLADHSEYPEHSYF